MAHTSNSTSPSSSRPRSGTRNSRVARRTTRSPRANPYPNPTPNRARRMVDSRRWDWLSTTLNTWRNVEGIHTTTEPMDISPYTQEPMHHTVPVLAARLHRHEDRLDDIQMEQHRHEERLDAMQLEQDETRQGWMDLAQGRLAQTYLDQMDLTETMSVVHNQVIGNRNEISVLHTRRVQCETRIRETEDHVRLLEQRLEEAIRMIGRLTENIERVVTLLPPPNPHQD